MNDTVRLMVLVPRNADLAEIPIWLTEIHEKVDASLNPNKLKRIELQDSKTWYRENFDRCGNYDSWIWDTVCGKEYGTRAPYFHGYILARDTTLGRANAAISELALNNGKPVLFWAPEAPLEIVTKICALETEDVTAGWTIERVAL